MENLDDKVLKHADEKILKEADTNEPRPQPVAEAAGVISGVSTGAGLGVIGGPIGILIGAAAGALGGWWVGHKIGETLKEFPDDEYRRRHARPDYDNVRDFYRFGHVAAANPAYHGRSFTEIEPELRRSIERDREATRFGRWEDVRSYVEEGYRGRQ